MSISEETAKIFSDLFSPTVVLDSGISHIISYMQRTQKSEKDKYIILIKISSIAKKKNTSVLDEENAKLLVEEYEKSIGGNNNIIDSTNSINNVDNVNKFDRKKKVYNSFNDIETEYVESYDSEMNKCHYIYENCCIYIDSFENNKKNIFSKAEDKTNMFLEQYNKLKYYMIKSGKFREPSMMKQNDNEIVLNPISSLAGLPTSATIFGLLTRNERREVSLQDSTGIVALDLGGKVSWGSGLFAPGAFVLVEGQLAGRTFTASAVAFPPAFGDKGSFEEEWELGSVMVRKAFGKKENENDLEKKSKDNAEKNCFDMISKINKTDDVGNENELDLDSDINNYKKIRYFYPSGISKKEIKKVLEKIENNSSLPFSSFPSQVSNISPSPYFLVFSDFDLENPTTLSNISVLLTRYEEFKKKSGSLPFMMVFLGNFVKNLTAKNLKKAKELFEEFSKELKKHKELLKDIILTFVPGPEDISIMNEYPKPGLPEKFIECMKGFKIINASNPCRFYIFGKEVVIFSGDAIKIWSREDIKQRYQTQNNIDNNNKNNANNNINDNSTIIPSTSTLLSSLISSILSSALLVPLDQNLFPRIWHLSSCLSLLPPPDFLVLADQTAPPHVRFVDVGNRRMAVLCPGGAASGEYGEVFPFTGEVNRCRI